MFMPSSYNEDDIHLHDHTSILGLWQYYGLVLLSLTGISTLMGLTDTICAEEVNVEFTLSSWSAAADASKLQSRIEPSIRFQELVFRYILKSRHTSDVSEKEEKFTLVRRFEFCFRPLTLHVIMLHLKGTDGVIHLVEIYHFRNIFLRFIFSSVLSVLSMTLHLFQEKRSDKKLN